MKAIRSIIVKSHLPERLRVLEELAYNLRLTWHPEAASLFRELDPGLWEESEQNPIRMLGAISQEKLNEIFQDEGFLAHMDQVGQDFHRYMTESGTYSFLLERPLDFQIAYFSPEYGLATYLPIYSGGLGMLAGDHLKSCSDLRIPIVAVGLLYQKGYFRQYLNPDGWQQEAYTENDFTNMPVQMEMRDSDKPLMVDVEMGGKPVRVHIWRVQVGRIPLYLLDTNVADNEPEDRAITANLYGGDREMRLRQEIILGIGGVRALKALGLRPSVFHMNEGHCAFAVLERVRCLMEDFGLDFDSASQAVTASNVFTTHTPVPAGIDVFSPDLIRKYFANYAHSLKISIDDLIALGQENPGDSKQVFSMAVLALRFSAYSNGVSKLHNHIARKMWRGVWPKIPEINIPITYVTNGVHIPSYISEEMASLYCRYLGPRWIEDPDNQKVWERVEKIPDMELWRTHERLREHLVNYCRERLQKQLSSRGATRSEIDRARDVLRPDALTIGFARRFATYKRGTLVFKDKDRLARIVGDLQRPVQFIFAGKAHPMDNQGKELIRTVIHNASLPEFREHIVFIEDYDIDVARHLVQGVDVWLNNPRRPNEACGTSGMKAAANGALNISVLDGWWCEGYSPEHGWAIGAGEEYEDHEYQDYVESQAIYNLLEKDVIPMFYDQGPGGLPRRWVAKMKSAMRNICPAFNTHRMIQEYVDKGYLGSFVRWRMLAHDDMSGARELALWEKNIRKNWHHVRVSSVQMPDGLKTSVGQRVGIEARIFLGPISPDDVSVEMCTGMLDSEGSFMNQSNQSMDYKAAAGDGVHLFEGTVSFGHSGKFGLNVRVLPSHPTMRDPHFMGLISWG